MDKRLNHLAKLRWYACIGVGLTLYLSYYAQIFPVWIPSFYALGVFALSNFLFLLFIKKIPLTQTDLIIFLMTIFDLFYLTLLLFKNGGSHNPFSILFFAICSVAAMRLPRSYLFLTICISLACLWLIYFQSSPPNHHHDLMDQSYDFHLRGMWVANSIGIIVVSYWIYHLRKQAELINSKHQDTQRVLLHVERLESLGKMVASTAHRLNTPLATMQLGISELSNKKQPLLENERDQWISDLQKSIHQISDILSSLKDLTDISSSKEEDNQKINFSDYIETVINRWGSTRNVPITYDFHGNHLLVKASQLREISSVIEALLENAFEAKKPDSLLKINVNLKEVADFLMMSIKDNGIGMNAHTLKHATEPLFTTKKAGTGLGLYIGHQLAVKLGGSLQLKSTLHEGTEVILRFFKNTFT